MSFRRVFLAGVVVACLSSSASGAVIFGWCVFSGLNGACTAGLPHYPRFRVTDSSAATDVTVEWQWGPGLLSSFSNKPRTDDSSSYIEYTQGGCTIRIHPCAGKTWGTVSKCSHICAEQI